MEEKCILIFKLERWLPGRKFCTEVSESYMTGYTIAVSKGDVRRMWPGEGSAGDGKEWAESSSVLKLEWT